MLCDEWETAPRDFAKCKQCGKTNTVGKSARAVFGRKDIGFGVLHGRRRKVRVRVPVQAQVQAPQASRRAGVRVRKVCTRMTV